MYIKGEKEAWFRCDYCGKRVEVEPLDFDQTDIPNGWWIILVAKSELENVRGVTHYCSQDHMAKNLSGGIGWKWET